MKKLILIILPILLSLNAQAFGERDSVSQDDGGRWSIYGGTAANYRFPKDTFDNYVFKIKPGFDFLIFFKIHKWGYLSTGPSYNIYTYCTRNLNGLGQYNEHNLTNKMVGLSLHYSLDLFPDKRIYPSFQVGFIANQLQSSSSIIYYSNGTISDQTDYQRGSRAIFFEGSIQLNVSTGQNLILVSSLSYTQQNKSFAKTNPSPPFDLAKIIRVSIGLKLNF